MSIQLEASWLAVLGEEFEKTYMIDLKRFLQQEKDQGNTVYPPGNTIFNALNTTAFEAVKVVIIGQDPYHGTGQAHGLSFSVPKGIAIPPSLQNIYKELQADIPGFTIPAHGNLHTWADQGVLLLNATLTVRANQAGSHQGKGWEQFTDAVIQQLNNQKHQLVFLLWGNYAKEKGKMIDTHKHLVLTAAHPSPFSAYNGFFGCKHFSKTNDYLKAKGVSPINWLIAN